MTQSVPSLKFQVSGSPEPDGVRNDPAPCPEKPELSIAEQTALLKQHEGFLFQQALMWQRRNHTIDVEDLLQEGRIALLHAASKHDGREGNLLTYARYWIYRAMREFVITKHCLIRVPRLHFGKRVIPVVSLHGPSERTDGETTLADEIGAPEPEEQLHEQEDLMTLVRIELQRLTPQQREVLEKRFIHGRKLADVGQDYGVSHERIRQIESKALRLLRNNPRLKKA